MSNNSLLDRRTGDERRETMEIERARLSIGTLIATMLIIVGLLTTYFASVNAVNARVSVLESQQEWQKDSLQRIEEKVDRILHQGR